MRPLAITADKALVLRRCAEEPRRVRFLWQEALCVPCKSAITLADGMAKSGLLSKTRDGYVRYATTDKGLRALAEYDARHDVCGQ